MKNIVQITVVNIPNFNLEVWYDLMEIPNTVNDPTVILKEFQKNMPDRKVRLIQILEE